MKSEGSSNTRIVFLDFEASSLLPGSFPIEVAWVDESGQGESYLIRPAPGWLDEAGGNPGWSRESEDVHGIPLATLIAEGKPHELVAARAARVLGAATVVCSDMPVSDVSWLRTLFDAADIQTQVTVVDVNEVYVRACYPLLRLLPPVGDVARPEAERRVRGLASQIMANAENQESLRPRVQHRALPDAESLWRTWRAIGDEARRRAIAPG
jgi:hypothetical protein